MEPKTAADPRRPFTLIDCMILVAFTAIGCLPLRVFDSVGGQIDRAVFPSSVSGTIIVLIFSPIALSWSMAFGALVP